VTEILDREIRTLRSLFWSERDPAGRGFAPLADAYRRAGDLAQAVELIADGLDRLPDFSTGHVVAARVHRDREAFDEAELSARAALDLDPENVEAMSVLADALEARGEMEEASIMRSRLRELEPDAAEAAAATTEPTADAVVEAAEPVAEAGAEPVAEEEEPSGVEAPEAVGAEAFEAAEWDRVEEVRAEETPQEESAGDRAQHPDEPTVFDVSVLAPAEPETDPGVEVSEEEVFDVSALAPAETGEPEAALDEEEIFDIGALAPAEPETAPSTEVIEEEEIFDIGALAPGETGEPEAALDEEEIFDISALAPGEPETEPGVEEIEEEVFDVSALAPGETGEPEAALGEEEVFDIGALAPGEPETEPGVEVIEEEVFDVSALAPAETEEPEAALDLEATEATEEAEESGSLSPEEALAEPEPEAPILPDGDEPLYTRTMAELYVRQGLVARAIEVYRHLLDASPDDASLREALDELLAPRAEPPEEVEGVEARGEPEVVEEPEAVEEVEARGEPEVVEESEAVEEATERHGDMDELAEEMSASGHTGPVHTPFAWTEEEDIGRQGETTEGPGISDYFRSLLAWEPSVPEGEAAPGEDGTAGGEEAGGDTDEGSSGDPPETTL